MMKSIALITAISFCFVKPVEAQIGKASWYGPGFQGKRTASGKFFDTNKLVAAHKTLKFGTRVRVTNLTNRKSVIVSIQDRGPYIKGRIIDLSFAAKQKLFMGGLAKVSLEIIN